MEYRKFDHTYVVRIDRGEEVMAQLFKLMEKEKIRLASVSGIGACDETKLGCYDVEKQEYHVRDLKGTFEITSLLGNMTQMNGENYLHIHITIADDHQNCYGGHLNECHISGTCELTVTVIDGNVDRKKDLEYGSGLNIFDFEN